MVERLKAIIFDFDGLILDTEYPEYLALCSIYDEYCMEVSMDLFGLNIGTHDAQFDPYEHLANAREVKVSREEFINDWEARKDRLVEQQPAMPGVIELITSAKEAGLKLAIGSSSPLSWVGSLAKRLEIFDLFDVIVTRDDVSRTKPSPEIFQLAAKKLDVAPEHCVVLEDSLNGLVAAKAAGIRSVWIPNKVTQHMVVDEDQPRVTSMAQVSVNTLDQLL